MTTRQLRADAGNLLKRNRQAARHIGVMKMTRTMDKGGGTKVQRKRMLRAMCLFRSVTNKWTLCEL